MRILKKLFVLILAFCSFPILVEGSSKTEDLFPEFNFEGKMIYEDQVAVTTDGHLIVKEWFLTSDDLKIIKYGKKGEVKNELTIPSEDSGFILKRPSGNIIILVLDYEKKTLTAYDENFKVQWARNLDYEIYKEAGKPYFYIHHFTEDTITFKGVNYMGETIHSFHFDFNGNQLDRSQIPIPDYASDLYPNGGSNYYFTILYEDGYENEEYVYVALEDEYDFDKLEDKRFFKTLARMQATSDYYFIKFPMSETEHHIIAVDRKTNKQIPMPTDFDSVYYSLEREQIYLLNENQFRVFDVKAGKVISTIPVVKPFDYDEVLHAIYDNEGNISVTFLDEKGQKRGTINVGTDNILVKKIHNYIFISTYEETYLYDFETLKKIDSLPYPAYEYNFNETVTRDYVVVDHHTHIKKIMKWDVGTPNNKVWTIHFNKALDKESVNEYTIFVVNKANQKQKVTLKVEDNKVYIYAPEIGYTSGEYIISVTTNVKNEDGVPLSKPVYKDFTVID